MDKVKIIKNIIKLPFTPKDDVLDGLQITMTSYWKMSDQGTLPKMTTNLIKGQNEYALPSKMKKKDIEKIAIILQIE